MEATKELSEVRTLTLIGIMFSFVSSESYVHTLRISYTAVQKSENRALTEDREQFDSQTGYLRWEYKLKSLAIHPDYVNKKGFGIIFFILAGYLSLSSMISIINNYLKLNNEQCVLKCGRCSFDSGAGRGKNEVRIYFFILGDYYVCTR